MQVKLKPDAALILCRRLLKHRRADGPGLFKEEREYADMIRQVQGTALEVETEHLFDDQYNTPPIPGVSDLGLRVMQAEVAEIIDDVRPKATKCVYCGKTRLEDIENVDKPCGCNPKGIRRAFKPARIRKG